jgi:hypothetical protein
MGRSRRKETFWLASRAADVILRAPVADLGGGQFVSEDDHDAGHGGVQNGGAPGRVSVSTGAESRTLTMKSAEIARFTLATRRGVPYHRDDNPTSYLYVVSFHTTAGFVPFLEAPPSSDSRFLGAHIRLVPEYADAETTMWSPASGKD